MVSAAVQRFLTVHVTLIRTVPALEKRPVSIFMPSTYGTSHAPVVPAQHAIFSASESAVRASSIQFTCVVIIGARYGIVVNKYRRGRLDQADTVKSDRSERAAFSR